jgi:branched-chain amino acid transport system permease protein
LPQHTGEVYLLDEKLDNESPSKIARQGLRRTYQQDRVPDTLTVGAYLRFVSRGKSTNAEIADTLEFFGCPPPMTPLRMVDVGTRRLIEVAANVAAKPLVLMLDEPAAGLSHDEHLLFADRLRQVPSRFGVTILIIEHDLDLVRSVCTSITVLNFGEVLASGSQEKVLKDPAVLKAYMGETEML